MDCLLSTTYFGPIQWYQKLCRFDCFIDGNERFVKQTYRNRCLIATTQGIQALTVPIEKNEGYGIKDIRISDHGNWRHLHWNALKSAYGESPFFDYYADDIRPFFEKKWKYLWNFNWEIMGKICELLQIEDYRLKTQDNKHVPNNLQSSILNPQSSKDYRQAIHPKHPAPDPDFILKPYYQVYQQKHGFIPNLSILDLLFNMGNEAILYLV
ncbi:MAG: WbqC family protein [Prevotella sp.]|nr:WbqC family protein [Prevotella sp.]